MKDHSRETYEKQYGEPLRIEIGKQLSMQQAERKIEQFVKKHIPLWHMLLIRIFPKLKDFFQYEMRGETNATKIEVWRRGKLIAKNY